MAQQIYHVRFEFVPRTAEGDMIYRTLPIRAHSAQEALKFANSEGFAAFGEFFNDNCVDWRLVK